MRRVIFAILFFAGCSLGAGAIKFDINGQFQKVKNSMPVGWKKLTLGPVENDQNKNTDFKPGLARLDWRSYKYHTVVIESFDAATYLYTVKRHTAVKGDDIHLQVRVRGHGFGLIGFFVLDDGEFVDIQLHHWELSDKWLTEDFTLRIKGAKEYNPESIVIFIGAAAKSKIICSDIEVYKDERIRFINESQSY